MVMGRKTDEPMTAIKVRGIVGHYGVGRVATPGDKSFGNRPAIAGERPCWARWRALAAACEARLKQRAKGADDGGDD